MKKAILIGVPHHSNLGDHAIAVAEKRMIQEKLPEYIYQEVPEENVHKCINRIEEYIEKDDIIFMHGGGNLGNEYMFIETGRRKIVERFKDNKIILFPQTMYFQNNLQGKKELEISRDIYNSHNNIFFMAREEISYESMKKEFNHNRIYFTPDIVTILQESKENTNRDGVLFIIRSDTESKIDRKLFNDIQEICIKNYKKIEFTDTAKGGVIYQNQREKKLNEMFDSYRKSNIVITDRLHGMIFAAITGTPCIALDNYNHKISSSYRWFKNLGYIKNSNNLKEIEEFIIKYKKNQQYQYNNKFSLDIFNKIFKEIKG